MLDEYLTNLFEQYYNFTFEDILENPENATSLPWYDINLWNCVNNFTFFDEYAAFNPNMTDIPNLEKFANLMNTVFSFFSCGIHFEINQLQPWILFIFKTIRENFMIKIMDSIPTCKALTLYDYNNDSFNTAPLLSKAIPIIFINRTLGEQINQSKDDYRIDIQLNQSWNDLVESYNIIGQINGSDSSKTILIECLYDSAWCQGTADSAIGTGMVLALAKFMKQLADSSVKPRYNVKFILFGGEEHGLKGAFYYEVSQRGEEIRTVIDLNQLGFIQTAPDVPLIMNVATNKILIKPILQHITDITDYEGRTNDNTKFKLSWTPFGSVSDERAFARWIAGRPLCKTVMFLKDFNWTRHHRDGENHTKGDTMDYYDQDDIQLVMEMIWNVTRAFAMNPDSWLENVEYTYSDDESDTNNDNDAVNVSFCIKTVLPEDKATVRLILVPTYLSNPLNPGYPILYRYRTEKEFIVTPEGTNGYISLQLPKGAPSAIYRIHLVLLNSTGDIYVDSIGKGAILGQVFENFGDCFEFFKDMFDINCEETLIQNSDEIQTDFHLDIDDFLDRYPHLTDIQDLIQDLFALYVFKDDKKCELTVLSPPNDPPLRPDTPEGPTWVMTHQENAYTTRTTDPNQDDVEYKWRFHLGDLIFNYNKWSNPYDSGEDQTQSNTWDDFGFRAVSVIARDTWHSPNVHSPRSPSLLVWVSPFPWIDAPTEQLVDEEVQLNGYLQGAEPYQLKWNMGESQIWEHTNESNPIKTYNTEGTYTITLNVTDEQQNKHLSTTNIEIKYMISNFSSCSGNTNTTLWFNDTSRQYEGYEVTNRTWDFDDGTIVYGTQNVSHTFLIPGVYNVSLTIQDEIENCIDTFSQKVYIENDPPVILDVTSAPILVAPDHTVTFYADVIDSVAGIKNVTLNITLPDSSWQVITMKPPENGTVDYDYDYTIEFNDTEQLGEYFYAITVEDNAGNLVRHGGFSFTVSALAFLPSTPYSGSQSSSTIPVDLSSTTGTSQHYAFSSLDNDLVVWMPMDITTPGGNPADVCGYENNGVPHGGANQTQIGFYGKGFLLDGVNDYIEMNSSSSLEFNSFEMMTWSFWIRPVYSTVNMTMGLLSKSHSLSNGSGFTFCLNTTANNTTFIIGTPDNGVMEYSNKINLSISNNSWALLTVVYNSSSGWRVYQNGSYLGVLFFPVTSNVNASYFLGAGRNVTNDTADLFFKGTIDDVVIIRRGLDVDEIHSLFNASAYPYSHNFTDVVDGIHNFTGYAGYLGGFANRTEMRSILLDTQPAVISNVSAYPDTVGFGGGIILNATVDENGSGLLLVAVNISYPDHSWRNFSMLNPGGDLFQHNFSDTWRVGWYNYSIWTIDNAGNTECSMEYSFNVTVSAGINIATLQDSYSGTQYINITDPPNPPENFTLIGQGLSWNIYYNASSGNNILETYQGPVNYQDENGTWTTINTNLCQLASNHPAYVYGYRKGNDRGLFGVYFKANAQHELPVAFTYNRSDDPTTYAIRSKLTGVGYVDPASNWTYQYLQNVQSSQGQTTGNAITYEDVFTGTDVTWSYGNTGLKEEITLSNTTKTMLQSHPPSLYGLHNASSYLVFITKLEHQNLDLYNESGILNGNVTISDKGIEFKDALSQFRCALPIGEAYEQQNTSVWQKLTYRIIHLNGNTYLLSGLKISDLIVMRFPVVIDPTLTVESLSNDGYITSSSTSYSTARNASTGTIDSSANYLSIGQKKTSGMPGTYSIYRGFVIFNTSALPTNAYLDNAILSLYKKDDYSTTDFLLTIQNGQPTYPHNPLQAGDYDRTHYSGNGGSLNTVNFTTGRNNITLTTLSWINTTGLTNLCLSSSRDINGNTPSGNEYVNVWSHEAPGVNDWPKLVITYRNQSKIKNIGSTTIKGYLLIQIQYYNISQGKWLVDNDTINETSTRTINTGKQLALDTIFNGKINASDLQHGTGTYRVYAAFRDPECNILKTNSGTELKAWWQFTKT